LDNHFDQQYQSAERAYGLGDYSQADALAKELLDRLLQAADTEPREIILGWTCVVSLLSGHIQLHGLQQPQQALISYQRALESEPNDTIAAIAKQGLERCRSGNTATDTTTEPVLDVATPDLLQDPFLTTDPNQLKPTQPDVITSMPWLPDKEEPQITQALTPTPDQALQPTATTEPQTATKQLPSETVEAGGWTADTPQHDEETGSSHSITSTPNSTPEPAVKPGADAGAEDATPESTSTSGLPTSNGVEPTHQESVANDLLEQAWLRRQIKGSIKNPTDSGEPMGLINRIKGVFARSAGR